MWCRSQILHTTATFLHDMWSCVVVGEELRNNRHFILEAVRLQGAALEYVPHFQEDEAGSGGCKGWTFSVEAIGLSLRQESGSKDGSKWFGITIQNSDIDDVNDDFTDFLSFWTDELDMPLGGGPWSSSIEQRSSAVYDPQVPTEFCSPSSRDCRPSWDWTVDMSLTFAVGFIENLNDLDQCILINSTQPLSWHWNWQRMQMMPRHEPWACSCGVSWRQGSCPGNLAAIYPQHCCPSEDKAAANKTTTTWLHASQEPVIL